MKNNFNLKKIDEYTRQDTVEKAWNISLRYSKLLLNKITNNKVDYDYCNDIYKQYIIELKSNKISVLKNKRYIKRWDDYMNTLNKNYYKVSDKNISNIINNIINLHYTSIIRN